MDPKRYQHKGIKMSVNPPPQNHAAFREFLEIGNFLINSFGSGNFLYFKTVG